MTEQADNNRQDYNQLAKRFGELTLKENLSPEEKAEYEELKNRMASHPDSDDSVRNFLDNEPEGKS